MIEIRFGFKIVPVEKNSTITGKLSFISDRNFRVENPYFWWHSSEKLQKNVWYYQWM